jgi:hypothetical protein
VGACCDSFGEILFFRPPGDPNRTSVTDMCTKILGCSLDTSVWDGFRDHAGRAGWFSEEIGYCTEVVNPSYEDEYLRCMKHCVDGSCSAFTRCEDDCFESLC